MVEHAIEDWDDEDEPKPTSALGWTPHWIHLLQEARAERDALAAIVEEVRSRAGPPDSGTIAAVVGRAPEVNLEERRVPAEKVERIEEAHIKRSTRYHRERDEARADLERASRDLVCVNDVLRGICAVAKVDYDPERPDECIPGLLSVIDEERKGG